MKPNVLIVDDSLTVRMDLAESFEAAGFQTTLCASLDAARKACAFGIYALVVLDVLLPDGDGVEFLCDLRGSPALSSVPIIMLSLQAEVADRIRGLSQGADEYVGKPYDSSYIVARASELVRGREPLPPTPAAATVLMLGDDAPLREQVQAVLVGDGHHVVLAHGGDEGLRQAVRCRPDLIVVDQELPGSSGIDVVRRLRADTVFSRTPCLVLSQGSPDTRGDPRQDAERAEELLALEAGADAYVRKEEGLPVIRERVAALLRYRGVAPRHPADQRPSLFGPKKLLIIGGALRDEASLTADSKSIFEKLATYLRQQGHDIVTAQTGTEALGLLEVQQVDCILIDQGPRGPDERDLCERIKGTPAWRDIPLLLFTEDPGKEAGGADPGREPGESQRAMLDGLRRGADDVLSRRADLALIKARLHAQLRRKAFHDEDLRTRARLERELHARDEFLSIVGHELRTPLTSLRLLLDTLLRQARGGATEPLSSPTVRGKLESIGQQVDRYQTLIGQLVGISRYALGPCEMHPEEFDLTALLRDVAARMAEAVLRRGCTVELRGTPGKVVGRWDRAQVEEVVTNLLTNAIKYGGGKPVELTVGCWEGRAWFTVRDQGIGIPAEDQVRIFERFERAVSDQHYGGFGLGLWTVKKILSAMGGEVSVKSQPGEGSTFRVVLPLSPPTSWDG